MKKLLFLFSFLILFSNASLTEAACNLYDESANSSSLYKSLALGHYLNYSDFNTLTEAEKDQFLNELFTQQRSLNPKISLETIDGCNGISLPLRFSKRNSTQNEFVFEEIFELPENIRESDLFNGFRYKENREITSNLSNFCEGNEATKTCSFTFRYPNSENEDSEDILDNEGYFEFQCSGDECNSDIKINVEFSVIDNTLASSLCSIPEGGVSFDTITFPDDEESITNLIVKLNLKTIQECSGKSIQIYLKERDTFQATDNIVDVTGSSDFVYWTGTERSIYTTTPTDEDLWITYKAHEDDCELRPGFWDCKIYVEVVDQDQIIYSSYEYLDGSLSSDNFENNINFKKGVIASECSGDGCELIGNDWKYLDNNGTLPSEQSGNNPEEIETTKPRFDRKSPCWREDVDPKKNGKQEGYDKNCYELLAPIPGIGEEFKVDGVRTGRWSIQSLNEFKLGDYVNTFFQLALGILMVLSVIMIVVAGVQYMTVESIYGKSDAKERIISSITGLILGLGIFVILNTINPKLLNINFGEGIKEQFLETKIDTAQMNFIDGTNTNGVVTPPLPEVLNYEPLIGYLYHQQGPGGAPTTLWAAKNGYPTVPTTGSPFISGTNNVQSNINAQFGSQMTPSEFVQKFYRVLKAKETQINTISPITNATAVQQAATEVGVDVSVLKTICMIESYDCSQADVVNSYGYTGLFQFHPERTWPEWRKNTSSLITNPYENAYAGAKFLKSNLQKYQSDKNQM